MPAVCLVPNLNLSGGKEMKNWHCLSGARLWLLFLVCTSMSAQQPGPLPWRWSHPDPHGNNIADMALWNGRYIQVTEWGQIYASSDLRTWRRHETFTREALRAVTIFKGSIVVAGAHGTIISGSALEKLKVEWPMTFT
jgi:hypothetical protein